MTHKEYQDYCEAVVAFFEAEGITNLSGGHLECPACSVPFNDRDRCPECNASRDVLDEPYFSWSPCECCQRPEGGDRYFATGYNPTTKEVQEYAVCPDCVFYAEYGRLDDTTMDEIERS